LVKPSEFSPATSAIIDTIVKEVFEPGHVSVIQGEGHDVGPKLLSGPFFNHVFFTGSPAVGREVMKMAAEHLIPVTLELGGKSPAIVESDSNIREAARRIIWGKFWNAGQTCITPDYVLVHQSRYDEFVNESKEFIRKFYGENALFSDSYGRMIHLKHLKAVASYISQGELLHGGRVEEKELYIEPTLVKVNDLKQEIMHKEIFGPVLPVLAYNHSQEVLEIISQNPDPLALYIFSKNRAKQHFYLTKIRFGGAGVNMPLLHFATVDMPLEGIGGSGTGNYHGKFGFETFSHRKSILTTRFFPDLRLKYPPFPALKGGLKWLLRKL
jgi:aldehyde dehydrogenase (NAD+)